MEFPGVLSGYKVEALARNGLRNSIQLCLDSTHRLRECRLCHVHRTVDTCYSVVRLKFDHPNVTR